MEVTGGRRGDPAPIDGVVPPRTLAVGQQHDRRIEDVREIDDQFLHVGGALAG